MNSAGVVYSGTPFTRVACGTVLIAACIIIAGADTVRACRSSEEQSLIMSRWLQSVSALINFVLAMTLYPEVQTRAQEELDRVVGRDRLPTFEDRAQLPYVSNVVKETLRWMPVSMLGTHPYCPASHDRSLSLMTHDR